MADSVFWRAGMLDGQKVLRCPYCVEGEGFKEVMKAEGGERHMCAHCGHLVVRSDPQFECKCAKCIGLRLF